MRSGRWPGLSFKVIKCSDVGTRDFGVLPIQSIQLAMPAQPTWVNVTTSTNKEVRHTKQQTGPTDFGKGGVSTYAEAEQTVY